MKTTVKTLTVIVSLFIINLSFGQLTQSLKIPIQGKTLNFDFESNGTYQGVSTLPVPNPSAYPNIPTENLNNTIPAQYVQQVVTNNMRDLLFFIKDSRIYDYRGFSISVYYNNNQWLHDSNPFVYTDINDDSRVRNLQVIPLDDNCYKYLIIWQQVNFSNQASGGYYSEYFYNTVYVDSDKNLSFTSPGNINMPLPMLILNNASTPEDNDTPSGFSISKTNAQKERFLFIHDAGKLYTFKINAQGINISPIFTTDYHNFSNLASIEGKTFWEESELIERNGYYYYVFASTGDHSSKIALVFIKFDSNGQKVFQTYKNVGYINNNGTYVKEYIKGLEFSENQDYLYFTQKGKGLQYINTNFLFTETSPGNIIQIPNTVNKFEYSHIELARDKKMYLINGIDGSLSLISNANTPSNLSINNQVAGISNLQMNSVYDLSTSNNTSMMQNYALTKQVDGSDYTSYYTNQPQQCCTDHFYYADDYLNNEPASSGTVQTWMPNNNPFNSDGSSVVYLRENLIIRKNANITITGMTFYFQKEKGIILESGTGSLKGAKLTLNNSKCTAYNGCGDNTILWSGIYLDGSNTSQTPTSNTQQPRLIVNNSTIEYGEYGIRNVNGGIVIATNSNFIDNIMATRTYGYMHNDISSYTKNVFKTTDILYNEKVLDTQGNDNIYQWWSSNISYFSENLYPLSFCYVLGSYNTKFSGNTFVNEASSAPWWKRGNGIYLYYSSAIIDHACSVASETGECDNERKNHFENLYYGVVVRKSQGASIKNSQFLDNVKGMRVYSSSTEVQIIGNDFDVANMTNDGVYGLSIESSPNFTVQNNIFHDGKVGMYVMNNGTVNDEVRHNEFYNLSYGIEGTGIIANGVNGEGGGENDGLNIRCNKFENNDFAIAVIDGNIAKSQYGDEGKGPSGNWFDHNNNAGGDTDFHIENSSISNYSYHQHPYGAAQELRLDWDNPNNPYLITYGDAGDYYTDMSVSNVGDASIQIWESACPDAFPIGGNFNTIGLSTVQLDNLKDELDTKRDELEVKVDGGNTILLKSKVDNLDNQNYINTCEELLEVGAYLSDDVLISFMQNEIDRPVAKTIVLLSNPILPNAAKQEIDNTNIPTYYKSYLKQLQNSQNPREVKEMEISSLKAQAEQLTTKMITNALLDNSVSEKLDSIITWLEGKQNLASYYRLHSLYMRKGQYDNANLNLENLVSEAQLGNTQDLIKAEYYKIMQQINMQIIQNPDEEDGIIRDNLSDLLDVANLTGKESGIARAMLYEYDSETYANYKTEYPLPNINRSAKVANVQANSKDTGSKEAMISVFPNPTNGVLNVEYINLGGSPTINIYDLKGTTIKSFKVQKEFGFKTFNLTDLSKGVYLIGFGKGQTTKFIVK